MNLEYFREALQLASYSGATLLNEEQAALIEHSLIQLQSENQFNQMFFWGRISAGTLDYYIAFGYRKDILSGRRFFFSVNCLNWYLLPPANSDLFFTCFLTQNSLTGDIQNVEEVLLDPKFITQPDGGVLPAKQEMALLKEEDRLACLVMVITEEAALMPRGALIKRIDGKNVYAPDFKGLRASEASKLNNYVIYRTPREKWNGNLLKRIDYNYSTDIFDTIDTIVPENHTFVLNLNNERNIVLVRSLYWPGMTFLHKCGSRKHGFFYFGDGRKNMDLLFML